MNAFFDRVETLAPGAIRNHSIDANESQFVSAHVAQAGGLGLTETERNLGRFVGELALGRGTTVFRDPTAKRPAAPQGSTYVMARDVTGKVGKVDLAELASRIAVDGVVTLDSMKKAAPLLYREEKDALLEMGRQFLPGEFKPEWETDTRVLPFSIVDGVDGSRVRLSLKRTSKADVNFNALVESQPGAFIKNDVLQIEAPVGSRITVSTVDAHGRLEPVHSLNSPPEGFVIFPLGEMNSANPLGLELEPGQAFHVSVVRDDGDVVISPKALFSQSWTLPLEGQIP